MDAYFSNRFSQAPKVDAPLVFVGWGLDIPERGYSDLQGLDLKGKVAVLLYGGSPSEIPGPLSAHYNDIRQRWAALKKAGAIGITAILNPHSMIPNIEATASPDFRIQMPTRSPRPTAIPRKRSRTRSDRWASSP